MFPQILIDKLAVLKQLLQISHSLFQGQVLLTQFILLSLEDVQLASIAFQFLLDGPLSACLHGLGIFEHLVVASDGLFHLVFEFDEFFLCLFFLD